MVRFSSKIVVKQLIDKLKEKKAGDNQIRGAAAPRGSTTAPPARKAAPLSELQNVFLRPLIETGCYKVLSEPLLAGAHQIANRDSDSEWLPKSYKLDSESECHPRKSDIPFK